MSSNRQIAPFLQKWRQRRDPSQVAGFTARFGDRAKPGLTQTELAALLGISEGWYRKLESGRVVKPTRELLEGVVRVLDLDEAERHTLYVFTTGEVPPQRFVPTTEVDPSTAALIRVQPWPAYISDWHWNVLMYNEAAERDWPWMKHGVNVMIWALTYQEARLQLINWETDWAKPMSSQLRLRAEAHPEDQELQTLLADVKARDTASARRLCQDLTTVTHPDGHRRKLYLPGHGEEEFEVVFRAYEPMGARSQRLMFVIPAEECADGLDVPPSRTPYPVTAPLPRRV
ncbi:helix-turn-helix transcriptional regulator [Streptomyces sp. NBC_00237]|uniref:MmyB family transcriptional regulator n=1 Tax=Streptomyces sp. NBC_00237 TaxID=2975687 RepID=UPI00225517AA|nr:helix-turn-helix domain-containing protein [Streptomyces sp. NBC_00237]MCX5205094.1 helix-turn-helix transcriptional regulator [Streptomyces sp. NBC_00237]